MSSCVLFTSHLSTSIIVHQAAPSLDRRGRALRPDFRRSGAVNTFSLQRQLWPLEFLSRRDFKYRGTLQQITF